MRPKVMIQTSILFLLLSLPMCDVYAFVPACLHIYFFFTCNQEKVAEISIKNMYLSNHYPISVEPHKVNLPMD